MCVFCPMFDGEASAECVAFDSTLTEAATAVMEYPAGKRLFEEGDDVTGVYCVRTGRVGLFKLGLLGESLPMAIAHSGDLLGVMDLMERKPYSSSAEVLEDSEVYFIPDDRFRDLATRRPVVVFNVMRRVCRQISELEARIGSDV